MGLSRNILLFIAFVTGLVALAIYLRSLSCDFVNLDDHIYVVDNLGIRSIGKDFWHWAFCTFPLNYWVPLLWVSFAIDYHFWGLNPFGYHLTNILLHAINSGLVVVLAHKVYLQSGNVINAKCSKYLYTGILLVAGLLFAIHPARVESVVWVTERKDVLNGVFTLGFLIYYLRYLQQKNDSGYSQLIQRDYIISLLLFTLSMLVKPSSILIPAALLLLDWYPLKRFEREKCNTLLFEKLPFLAMGALIVSISIIFRIKQGGFNSLADFPMLVRTVAAGNSIIEYFKLMLFPINILPYYILPRHLPVLYAYKAVTTALILCSTVLFREKFPAFAVSVLFFVVTIVPSLHFITDGWQTVLSPRYTYLPCILACILAAPALVSVCQRIALKAGRLGAYIAVSLILSLLLFFAATSFTLIGDWKNSGTMWTKVIENKPFDRAYYARGLYHAEKGEYLAAINDYSDCIRLATKITIESIYNVYAFRGEALAKAGYFLDAADDFTSAITLHPHPLYFYNRGVVYKKLGRLIDAEADFIKAGDVSGKITEL